LTRAAKAALLDGHRRSASRPRGDADYADRILSAKRKEFGGHDEKSTGGN
jgi:6-phosphogluconate dehydrogenase (decarboxylating)